MIATRASWLAQKQWRGQLAFLPAVETKDWFPISAAVRKSDHDLKDAVDRAWIELDRSGHLAEVFARWPVPYERARVTAQSRETGS